MESTRTPARAIPPSPPRRRAQANCARRPGVPGQGEERNAFSPMEPLSSLSRGDAALGLGRGRRRKGERMESILGYMERYDYENLFICQDRTVGLRAVIALHDTTLGPAT